MISPLTIPKQKNRPLAMDRQQLFEIGRKYIQELSGRIWTDYNLHDPGVTTLELLCYALTDLSYRASFPIEDLLASKTDNAEEMKKQFFTARQILPDRPLTLLDYRKLLIDIEGVKNAWLHPASQVYYADTIAGELLHDNPERSGIVEVNIAGWYEVKIQYEADAIAEDILPIVGEKLQANRNLCEDFLTPNPIETQLFQLCVELELTPDANVTKVNADILFQVQEYLSPSVRFYTLAEMLARQKADGTPYTVEEIFDGPALDRGFIDDEELEKADLRTEIRLSDIISIIMDIPGVQAVRDIVINPEGSQVPLANKWIVPIEAGKQALLNPDPTVSRLVFYKRNMPVVPGHLTDENEGAIANSPRDLEKDLPIPLGKYRELERYYSFQNHFPAIYGLSDIGLSSTADDKRKALAYQLKAYLLFFDQIMANYFAQLSRIKELFSLDPELRHTYFYQVVDSFKDYQKIYAGDEVIDPLQTESNDREENAGFDRRNRFLDHLIARFAERFHDFANIMYSAFGESPEQMLRYKCDFLKNYPGISSERSLAYNYSLQNDSDLWNTENVSGLEKRLAKLLGIRDFRRRNLGEMSYDIYAEIDESLTDEFRFRIRQRDTLEILLSSSTKYETRELARTAMEQAIHAALLPSGYQRKISANDKYYFNIIDGTGEIVARRIEYFNTEGEMNRAIDELREYLQENYSDEGMYLIENILFLQPKSNTDPEPNTDPFLPICPNPNCTDCVETDPYSYRLAIILPAYSDRFRNMNFRRFVEGIIREETPAHILPKICWIGKDDMAEFEKLYRDWIYLKAGVEKANREEKLQKFIDKLFAVKSVYPQQKLWECNSEEERDKFILNRTILGSDENIET
ncbi:MAG: diguanylate cyclase [Spirulina sp.]